MLETNIAGFCYHRKQNTAKSRLGHATAVRLKDLFRKRLQEEMDAQGVSANSLADRCRKAGADIGQTTISAILRGKQGASMDKVEELADGLGVPAWFLFTDREQVEQRVIKPPTNVVRLPDPYPKIFGPKTPQPRHPQSGSTAKQHSRKKR
jgi:transcriptional regulator with XRE-family HTH domain